MRVLDIDMDFFMDIVAGGKKEGLGIRLTDRSSIESVWSKDRVTDFIEKNLGLSKRNKIKGRVFKQHKDALYFWEELIDNGYLECPFEVVHVDSHSDLSYWDTGYEYVYNELSKIEINERRNYMNRIAGGINKIESGNYLLYAIAFGYISELVYCTNPNRCLRNKNYSGQDYNRYILKDEEHEFLDGVSKNYIQIMYNKDKKFNEISNKEQRKAYVKGAVIDPPVKFTILNRHDKMQFAGVKFDFINIAQSPEYTPENADFILDIFREYIQEI